MEADVQLWREVRLAIGPLSRPDDIGPIWETRSRVRLLLDGKPCDLTSDRSLTPLAAVGEHDLSDYEGTVAACTLGGWRRVTGFGKGGWQTLSPYRARQQSGRPDRWTNEGEPLNEEIGFFYDDGIYVDTILATGAGGWWSEREPEFVTVWERLNAETVRQLVDMVENAEAVTSKECRVSEKIRVARSARSLSKYRFDLEAREIEEALAAGTIEEELLRSCKTLSIALSRRKAERLAVIAEQDAKVVARWRGAFEEKGV